MQLPLTHAGAVAASVAFAQAEGVLVAGVACDVGKVERWLAARPSPDRRVALQHQREALHLAIVALEAVSLRG